MGRGFAEHQSSQFWAVSKTRINLEPHSTFESKHCILIYFNIVKPLVDEASPSITSAGQGLSVKTCS